MRISTTMDSHIYHFQPELSHSQLKHMYLSPWDFYQQVLSPIRPLREPSTSSQLLGERIHCAALEPEIFRVKYKKGPAVHASSKEWKNFCADFHEHEVLKPEYYDNVVDAAQAFRNHPLVRTLLEDKLAVAECSIFFEHMDVKCRSRLDLVTSTCIVDLKTANVEKHDFERQCAKNFYHTQAAFYELAVSKINGGVLPFLFVALQPEYPYKVVVYRPDVAFMQEGREQITAWLQEYKKGIETNIWPSYTDSPIELTLPKWSKNND